MTNTAITPSPAAQTWVKPEPVRLGQIADVAGTAAVNADGQSANPKS